MTLVESLLGYRTFASEREIRRSIKTSESYDSMRESPDDARSLLIFETSKQQTWLVATGDHLYFVLDDVRGPAPRIARAVGRSELANEPDGTIAVDTQPKSVRTGLVDVGRRRRGWLYSKALFPSSRPIEHAIVDLLQDVDGDAQSQEKAWKGAAPAGA